METKNNQTAAVNLTNTIGRITESRVIIYKGKSASIIQIEDIKSINLSKKRLLYGNLAFLVVALVLAAILISYKELELLIKLGSLALVLICALLCVFHKFYIYQMTIGLKGEKSFVINASQLRKEQIKNFHFLMRKKLRGNKFSRIDD